MRQRQKTEIFLRAPADFLRDRLQSQYELRISIANSYSLEILHVQKNMQLIQQMIHLKGMVPSFCSGDSHLASVQSFFPCVSSPIPAKRCLRHNLVLVSSFLLQGRINLLSMTSVVHDWLYLESRYRFSPSLIPPPSQYQLS